MISIIINNLWKNKQKLKFIMYVCINVIHDKYQAIMQGNSQYLSFQLYQILVGKIFIQYT